MGLIFISSKMKFLNEMIQIVCLRPLKKFLLRHRLKDAIHRKSGFCQSIFSPILVPNFIPAMFEKFETKKTKKTVSKYKRQELLFGLSNVLTFDCLNESIFLQLRVLKSFSRSLKYFFLTVGRTIFETKYNCKALPRNHQNYLMFVQ